MLFCAATLNEQGKDAVMKYFILQVCAGATFLLSIVCSAPLGLVTTMSILAKLGLVPFYHWVVVVLPRVRLGVLYAMSTLIKIPGVVGVSLSPSRLVSVVFVAGVIVSSCGGRVLVRLKKLLAYSSVGQTRWLAITCVIS